MVDAWVVGFDLDACEHDAGTDDAGSRGPLFHLLFDGFGIGVERSDEAEASGVFVVDLEGVTGVVLVHGERGYEDGAVDTDRVHCRDHVIAGDFGRAFQVAVPGSFGMVVLIGVDLDVDYWGSHDFAYGGDGLSFRGSDDVILLMGGVFGAYQGSAR